MDKELLRIVIILMGVLVMIGMLLWSFFKSLKERREEAQFGNRSDGGDDAPVLDDDSEEFDMAALSDSALDGESLHVPKNAAYLEDTPTSPPSRKTNNANLPALIEFSVMARDEAGFNGEELFDLFERLGLEYGSMKVFERVDDKRLVDFTIANILKPGTFPNMNLATFFTPGVVFFMQPKEVDDPLAVFEDFMETMDILADELNGDILDKQRQPLTEDTVELLRELLA